MKRVRHEVQRIARPTVGTSLGGREALFVVPRSALLRGTKTVRGKFVEDMKGELVKRRLVAAEVARDVRCDLHARTQALKALRMTLSLAAKRDGKRRPRSVALAFVRATTDEVWQYCQQTTCWNEVSASSFKGTPRHSKGFQAVAALHESAQETGMAREPSDGWDVPSSRSCGHVRMPWR